MRERAASRILVVRADRLGDVILSTPVFEALKKAYPKSHITVLVRETVAPLLRGLPTVDEVLIYDPEGAHKGAGGFFRLMGELRERKFRVAVMLQSQRRIAAAIFGAGIRHRIGPFSKPHSYLFYNRGLRQRRSHVEMHEADYNLQLLYRLGIRVPSRKSLTQVNVPAEEREWARQWLKERGIRVPEVAPQTPQLPDSPEGAPQPTAPKPVPGEPLVIIHPGMGGSALNWPEEYYVGLARALLNEGIAVVLTGGSAEGLLLNRVREKLAQNPPRRQVVQYGGTEAGSIERLAGLMSWASLVVAPSTGPLHLAVALGKRVVCFYPPIRVQSAVRWGPYLADESRASVLVPEGYCGQDFECRGNFCNYYPCMKSISVSQALEQCHRQLAQEKNEHAN